MTLRETNLATGCLVALLLVGGRLAAQEQAAPRFDYTNTENCLLCHGDNARMADHADFVGVVPAETWSRLDKHSQSFLLLTGKSRALTNQILGFDLREAFADEALTSLSENPDAAAKLQSVQTCLRCHATWPAEAVHPGGKATDPVEPLSRGVSCQACHGPAGEWVDAHTGQWWRRVSHKAKTKLGFTDVRDAVVKAELCASCHVGDLAGGKFIRHEWYAAGHPPLPGFELSTFSSQMPLHWKRLTEKPDFAGRNGASPAVSDGKAERIVLKKRNIDILDDAIRPSYEEANVPAAAMPRTQEVVVSGAVVLKAYVKLAGDYAEQAAAGKRSWPEFALYDCAACHHELRRREGLDDLPARRGPPGRPPLARWPSALTGLLEVKSPDLSGLESAYTERPFGDAKKIVAAAKLLLPQLEESRAALRKAAWNDMSAEQVLVALTSSRSAADFRDYASARQIAWAIQALRKDQERIPHGFGTVLTQPQRESLRQIDALFLRDSRDELRLILPAQQNRFVVEEMPEFLKAMGDFDSQWFAERISGMRKK